MISKPPTELGSDYTRQGKEQAQLKIGSLTKSRNLAIIALKKIRTRLTDNEDSKKASHLNIAGITTHLNE